MDIWTLCSDIDMVEEPLVIDPSEYAHHQVRPHFSSFLLHGICWQYQLIICFFLMKDLKLSKPFRLSSIGNWLQCRKAVDDAEGVNGNICGKWRRWASSFFKIMMPYSSTFSFHTGSYISPQTPNFFFLYVCMWIYSLHFYCLVWSLLWLIIVWYQHVLQEL